MAEWLKAHAWKACIPQGIQGSNPCLSAISFLSYYRYPDIQHCFAAFPDRMRLIVYVTEHAVANEAAMVWPNLA
jgi:hypothetical protein